ncbi:MAG: FtsK/SpoIIIE domain-containing protein [Anaerolineales bacterium]
MSTSNRQFSLALEALAELKMETSTSPTQPVPAAPALSDVLTEMGPLPREALFLGVASDGLPVLLNLHDPLPGPILVTGQAGSGKTTFLQTVARATVQTHTPEDVQFGVITPRPEEWDGIEPTPHLAGLFSNA